MRIENIKLENKVVEIKNYDSLGIIIKKSDINSLEYDFLKAYVDADYFKENTSVNVINGNKILNVHLSVIDDETIDYELILNKVGSLFKIITSDRNIKNVAFDVRNIENELSADENLHALVKGIFSGSYSFEDYKSSDNKKCSILDNVDVFTNNNLGKEFDKANTIIKGSSLTRYLVELPANILKPKKLAEIVNDEFKDDSNVEVKIYKKDEIEELSMNLFLSVAKGSKEKPYLIVMRYNGDKDSKEVIGLVGKGLTYDSGGYSIKPTDSMIDMKSDMGGAAAVIGAMKNISSLGLKKNVVAVVAACENMISGASYLPGDIIKSMNGKTVEIVNTDAEGRLTLADAMCYTIRHEKVTKILDICTLTGACVVALGDDYAAIITEDEEMHDKMMKASKATAELCHRLPINASLKAKNKSKVADLKNSGGRWGGCISAGAFVGEFSEDVPFIHVDIAGVALLEGDKEYQRQGATGFGADLLSKFVELI